MVSYTNAAVAASDGAEGYHLQASCARLPLPPPLPLYPVPELLRILPATLLPC